MSITKARQPSAPADGAPPGGSRRPERWLLGVLAGAAAVGLTVGLLVATTGNGRRTTPSTTSPSTTAPGTTMLPPTTLPPTTLPPTTLPPTTVPTVSTELALAVYPTPGSGILFAEPVAAARSFAVDFVGFVDPVVGRFVASGAESGTVSVRATAGGAVTTVRLHRIGGRWWVLGSSTPDIRLDSPAASAAIRSPVRLRGWSTAYEAQVNVEVRQDGARSPIGTGYVMGGSMGVMGPFDGSVAFALPRAPRGALVLSTVSMETGHVWQATVVRVVLAPAVPLVPTAACPDYAMDRPSAPPGEMVVTVFYSCSAGSKPVPTYRLYPVTAAVLRTSLEALLAGPTAAERDAGLTSWFSASTAGYLRSVTIVAGQATVDLGDLRSVVPNTSTSTGSRLLLSQLDATVFQFPTVTSVIYRIDGSCQTFGEWLQLDACVPRIA